MDQASASTIQNRVWHQLNRDLTQCRQNPKKDILSACSLPLAPGTALVGAHISQEATAELSIAQVLSDPWIGLTLQAASSDKLVVVAVDNKSFRMTVRHINKPLLSLIENGVMYQDMDYRRAVPIRLQTSQPMSETMPLIGPFECRIEFTSPDMERAVQRTPTVLLDPLVAPFFTDETRSLLRNLTLHADWTLLVSGVHKQRLEFFVYTLRSSVFIAPLLFHPQIRALHPRLASIRKRCQLRDTAEEEKHRAPPHLVSDQDLGIRSLLRSEVKLSPCQRQYLVEMFKLFVNDYRRRFEAEFGASDSRLMTGEVAAAAPPLRFSPLKWHRCWERSSKRLVMDDLLILDAPPLTGVKLLALCVGLRLGRPVLVLTTPRRSDLWLREVRTHFKSDIKARRMNAAAAGHKADVWITQDRRQQPIHFRPSLVIADRAHEWKGLIEPWSISVRWLFLTKPDPRFSLKRAPFLRMAVHDPEFWTSVDTQTPTSKKRKRSEAEEETDLFQRKKAIAILNFLHYRRRLTVASSESTLMLRPNFETSIFSVPAPVTYQVMEATCSAAQLLDLCNGRSEQKERAEEEEGVSPDMAWYRALTVDPTISSATLNGNCPICTIGPSFQCALQMPAMVLGSVPVSCKDCKKSLCLTCSKSWLQTCPFCRSRWDGIGIRRPPLPVPWQPPTISDKVKAVGKDAWAYATRCRQPCLVVAECPEQMKQLVTWATGICKLVPSRDFAVLSRTLAEEEEGKAKLLFASTLRTRAPKCAAVYVLSPTLSRPLYEFATWTRHVSEFTNKLILACYSQTFEEVFWVMLLEHQLRRTTTATVAAAANPIHGCATTGEGAVEQIKRRKEEVE